jgi:hypothetical protein
MKYKPPLALQIILTIAATELGIRQANEINNLHQTPQAV